MVGTVPEMFTELKYRGDQSYEFAAGRELQGGEPLRRRAGRDRRHEDQLADRREVSGRPRHGEGGRTHKETFHVVGILAPTGTPVDRAIFVNMQGFYEIHHHEEEAEEHGEHEEHDEARRRARRRRREQASHRRAGLHPKNRRRPRADRRGGQADQRRQGGPGRRARPGDHRPVRGHRRQAAMDPAGHGRADGDRGGHRHHGQHLQLDERPAARNRRHAGARAPAASP